MKYIYIAGPLTVGDQAINVRNAMDAGSKLLASGFVPFIPHLTWFWHLCNPEAYDDWIEMDLKWLLKCDALLRLPGESKGADIEVRFALDQGLLVYHGTVEDFLQDVERLGL